jgi:hypothetical protein
VPSGLRRVFHYGVTAARLYQTANQGQRRPAFRLGLPAAGTSACALENHAFPTSALQSDKITLCRAVAVQCRLDARAAAGHSPLGPICLWTKPSRAGVQSKRRGRERWRTGASRDQRPHSGSIPVGARPWRASVRRCGSPARSVKFLRCGHRSTLLGRFGAAAQRRRAGPASSSHGTGRCRRWHKSSTAACSGRRRSAAHKSRALPPAPQRKQ